MSYLGNTISRLLQENRIAASTVAKKSGLHTSQITRWKSGEILYISQNDLAALASGIGKNQHQRAQIILAHLKDECACPGGDLIDITIRETGSKEREVPSFSSHLSPRTKKAFEFLADAIPKNPSIEQAVIAFAKSLGLEDRA